MPISEADSLIDPDLWQPLTEDMPENQAFAFLLWALGLSTYLHQQPAQLDAMPLVINTGQKHVKTSK